MHNKVPDDWHTYVDLQPLLMLLIAPVLFLTSHVKICILGVQEATALTPCVAKSPLPSQAKQKEGDEKERKDVKMI